jgi:hypothetical protein
VNFLKLALEFSIQIGLAILLSAACLLILLAFIPMVAWGIIIAVAAYPAFKKLQRALGGRGVVASVLFAVVFLAFLIVPAVLLANTLIEGVQEVASHVRDGTPIIPPPPAGFENWPIIGGRLNSLWSQASTDINAAIRAFAPQIKAAVPGMLSVSAGLGSTVLQFALSILLAAVLLANAQSALQRNLFLIQPAFWGRRARISSTDWSDDSQRYQRYSWRGRNPGGSRRTRLFRSRFARRGLVGRGLSTRSGAAGGGARTDPRGNLYVYESSKVSAASSSWQFLSHDWSVFIPRQETNRTKLRLRPSVRNFRAFPSCPPCGISLQAKVLVSYPPAGRFTVLSGLVLSGSRSLSFGQGGQR